MERIRKVSVLVGIVLAITVSIGAFGTNRPTWFCEDVYESTGYVLISILILSKVTVIISRYFLGKIMFIFLLILLVTGMFVPTLYISGAVFLGRIKADLQTFHLLPLFTIMHQLTALIIVGTLSGFCCIFYTMAKRIYLKAIK